MIPRFLSLILLPFGALAMCANEPIVGYLEKDESVAHMAVHGDTLAVAVGYRAVWEPGSGSALPEDQSAVALVRDGVPLIRTPLQPGAMRSIIATPSGFVAARVIYDRDGRSTACFLGVDLSGTLTAMPQLQIDLVGLWVDSDGAVFAYSPRAVFRWTVAQPNWAEVPLDPSVSADAIRRIVTVQNGSSLVVTDRLLKGFKRLQEPPIFVRDLNTYPQPIKAYGDDRWWIITSGRGDSKVSIVGADGQVQEVAMLRMVNPHELLFHGDKVYIVCSREGGNVHKTSYYVLNRDGSGPLRGPFMLPDDTMSACIWNDCIVSGGATNRVFKTPIVR